MTNEFELLPYVTEKSSSDIENNKYHFLLIGNANKIEIGHFFKKKYEVSVKKININKKLSKKTRRGKTIGKTKGFKKVILTMANEKNNDKLKELF